MALDDFDAYEVEIPDWVEDFDDLREWAHSLDEEEGRLAFSIYDFEGLGVFDDWDDFLDYLDQYSED